MEKDDTIIAHQFDTVKKAKHYNSGKIETMDYIEDQFGAEGTLGFCLGNTLKYISRFKHKGTPLQDLRKAEWYLGRAIEVLEGKK